MTSPYGYVSNYEVAQIDRAIDACEDYQRWNAIVDERFAAWFRFERDERGRRVVHGNSVRRAEAAANRRSYVAIDRVYEIDRRFRDRIFEQTSGEVGDPEVVRIMRAIRDEIAPIAERNAAIFSTPSA